MSEKKQIGPRVTEISAEFYASMFEAMTPGSEFVLDAYPSLYRKTLREVKGKFSPGELKLMCEVMMGCLLTPSLSGDHLLANAQSGAKYDGLDQKWEVDFSEFEKKFEALTIFQKSCLEVWTKVFWTKGGQRKNLPTYVKELV
jgi:hypothetical protein